MAQKINTRAVGLDVSLAFIRWHTGTENLHYGLWAGLDVTASNRKAAQEANTAKLFVHLPAGPLRILAIGGGSGETARKLLALGHSVEIVVPSAFLAARCREAVKGAVVHECTFEDFAGTAPFDSCLFFEKPAVYWTLARFIGLFLTASRRRNLMERLTGPRRNAAAF